MKKRLLLLALVLVCALALSACGCKHETWIDADCVTPKTCQACGETEGAPLGHSWLAATCETAKTCETCAEVDGEAKGHQWTEAGCETPKTCESCRLTEGEPLGHSWKEATTEEPKTCEGCGLTEGERIVTDPRFTTADAAELQGIWVFDEHVSSRDNPEVLEQMPFKMDDFEIHIRFVLELDNDGSMSSYIELPEDSGFDDFMISMIAEGIYTALEEEGVSRQEADVVCQKETGMTVKEYAAYSMESIDLNSMFASYAVKGVYYVEDGILYTGMTWDSPMEAVDYTLEGDSLTINSDPMDGESEVKTFTRSQN